MLQWVQNATWLVISPAQFRLHCGCFVFPSAYFERLCRTVLMRSTQQIYSGPLRTFHSCCLLAHPAPRTHAVSTFGVARASTYSWPLLNRARISGLSSRPEFHSHAASYEAITLPEGTKQPSQTSTVFGLACPICVSTPFNVKRQVQNHLHVTFVSFDD